MNNKGSSVYISTKDFLVSGESFELLRDEKNEMLITSPQPKPEDLARYYESEAYISHTDSDKGLMARLYQLVKKYSLSKKLRLITSLNEGTGSLLDIGAGTGEFLKLAKEYKWKVAGIEPNEKARNFAQQKGLELFSDIDDLSVPHYDVVTLWHVLEHLPDLKETIVKIEGLVKPGGALLIAVPNYKSYDAKHYKKYWAAYDVPRHLWHFSRTTLSNLFSEQFKLRKTKPMIFDSFYVSLLSEKYKSDTKFSIKAIFIGLWSNLSAISTKEHSSIVYCFKKQS